MTIQYEKKLQDFDFWAGAKVFADKLTADELNTIEKYLEMDRNGEPISETELNDFIWFSPEIWTSWIGETEDSIMERG
jgi:hypothetical protein